MQPLFIQPIMRAQYNPRSTPPPVSEEDRQRPREMLGHEFGKRDRLRYTKRFDELVDSFNRHVAAGDLASSGLAIGGQIGRIVAMATTNEPQPKTNGDNEWVARTTAILAVIAAISSGRWGASNLGAILEQGKVNDTWSYYQAKSMKQHDAEQTRDLAAALAPGQPPASAQSLEDLRKRMAEMAKREEEEKNEQQAAALRFQESRDHMVESSFWFEVSFAGLQLGVILCTIATGAKRRVPWLVGMAFGAIGLLLMINGFHRIVHAPRSWYHGASEQMAYEVKPSTSR